MREVCVCVWSVRHAGARMHDLCCMFVCVAGALTLAAVALFRECLCACVCYVTAAAVDRQICWKSRILVSLINKPNRTAPTACSVFTFFFSVLEMAAGSMKLR